MGKRIRISNETLNCYGTWVKTEGVDITQYERNPVLLWMHWRGVIIGCIKDIKIEGEEITGEPYFDEVRDESKLAKSQFEKGTLKMASANFDIIETSDDAVFLKPGQTRPTVTKSKLIEVSMVDIGGNDDAITLSHDGKELKLANGEDCDALPLLLINNENKSQTTEKMETNLKAIALKLGLAETATEADILGKIGILLAFQATNVELKKQLDDIKLAGITTLVDEAVKSGKVKAEMKDHFMKLGKTMGVDELKLTLSALAAPMKPMDVLGGGNSGGVVAGSYTKLSEVPSAELELMREKDPGQYIKLFKAEYGYECKI